MVIVATGGNLIVIWIVLAHKRMRTVTNYFIVNLSIADAMVSTLNVTFNYTYMLNAHWPFGTIYCKISQFVAILSICASVFTLMAISIDR
uniref:Putative tachykinin-like peptides receptor 99d cyphomyrmex costatus n=2 Tax=Phlebotominae TaxID=7198 RepID=A0A7G3AZK5_LUTLO